MHDSLAAIAHNHGYLYSVADKTISPEIMYIMTEIEAFNDIT